MDILYIPYIYTRGDFQHIENFNQICDLHNKLIKLVFSLIFLLFLVEILSITGKMLKLKIFLICYVSL